MCLCIPMLCKAQGASTSLIVDGKVWKGYETDGAGKRYQYDYFLDGDTVWRGKKYLKCFCYSERKDSVPRYVGALLEEKGKVYGIQAQSTAEGLLFDFNMQVGDSVYCYLTGAPDDNTFAYLGNQYEMRAIDNADTEYSYYLKLEDIDEVRGVDNASLRRFRFKSIKREIFHDNVKTTVVPEALCWIEGIGVENYYPFYSWASQFDSSYKYQLEECYINQKLLYSRAGATSINPATCQISKPYTPNLYDLQGRRLSSVPRKGVYVRNGKKYVMK